MTRIIDAQSHYMPPAVAQNTTFFKVNWSDEGNHLRAMDEHGIEKSLLLYPTSDAHMNMGNYKTVCQAYNQGIADIVKKYPDRFIGAGIIPPEDKDAIKEELERISNYGFKVISLASSYNGRYLDDELFLPVFEYAKKTATPIHVHPQIIKPIGEERIKDPLLSPVLEYVMDVTMCIGKLLMGEVFLKFADVKFIFAHYGGVLPIVKERFDNTYSMLLKRGFVKDLKKNPSEYFKNIYFDTSGSQSHASLLCALEVVDPSNILWASDYPANQNMQKSISVINESPLSDQDKAAILGGNLTGLLGLSK